MKKNEIVRQLLKQSRFLAFTSEDLKRYERRHRSGKYVYARFGFPWSDNRGNSRKSLSIAVRTELKDIFAELKAAFSDSNHELNYASLRAEAGKPVLQRIVFDILSADLLVFDLAYRNPNVLFELGIAYAIGAKAFLLLPDGIELPSDLSGLTYCKYKNPEDFSLDRTAREDIKRAMREVLKRKLSENHAGR